MTKILVVEDDKSLLKAYEFTLSSKGFEVRLAENGQVALDILASYIPDIIILDLVMPIMDGFTLLVKIKENADLKNIPVLVVTNLAQSEDILKAMKMGASDYLIKTDFSTRDLVEKIGEYVTSN
ncbi:response regulator [Candidatus Woesebacteria bacterium]|nr:MAG: response regulator [Candidatus Woesebacteria bacterium]